MKYVSLMTHFIIFVTVFQGLKKICKDDVNTLIKQNFYIFFHPFHDLKKFYSFIISILNIKFEFIFLAT